MYDILKTGKKSLLLQKGQFHDDLTKTVAGVLRALHCDPSTLPARRSPTDANKMKCSPPSSRLQKTLGGTYGSCSKSSLRSGAGTRHRHHSSSTLCIHHPCRTVTSQCRLQTLLPLSRTHSRIKGCFSKMPSRKLPRHRSRPAGLGFQRVLSTQCMLTLISRNLSIHMEHIMCRQIQ